MNPKKNEMPTQAPEVRAHNFSEVALGYEESVAVDEANRCLNCKTMPCVSGCPVNIHIPEFIAKIRELDFEGAYKIITQTSSLPAVCGRVCPQETQCESKCVRGIKGKASASAGWKGSLPIITTPIPKKLPKCLLPTVTKWRLSAPVPRD